jgi:hypothetical protein
VKVNFGVAIEVGGTVAESDIINRDGRMGKRRNALSIVSVDDN